MAIGFSSIFKGLASLYESTGITPSKVVIPSRLYIAEVVDTILSKQHAKYTSESDLGAIVVRNIDGGRENNKDESSLSVLAYPADIATTKIPLPGEFVIVMKATPGDYLAKGDVLSRDVYINTISNLSLLNYNGLPFAGATVSSLLKGLPAGGANLIEVAAKRHESRFTTFVKRQIKRLRPYDGDTILQGRFGNSIRLGSTIVEENNYGKPSQLASLIDSLLDPDLPAEGDRFESIANAISNEIEEAKNNESTWSSTGLAGDPIIIMRTRQPDDIELDLTKENFEQLTVEDINRDGSSVYLCQNQTVKLKLQIADVGLRTWRTNLGLPPVANNAPQPTKTSI